MNYSNGSKKKFGNFQKGQSLFEVLFAFTVMTLIVVAIVGLATVTIRNSSYSKNKTVATSYAQQTIEWLRGEKDKSWSNFFDKADSPATTWCLVSLPDSVAPSYSWGTPGSCDVDELVDELFIREVDMERGTTAGGDPFVEVTVSVSWTDSQGLHEVRLVTDFSNWQAE